MVSPSILRSGAVAFLAFLCAAVPATGTVSAPPEAVSMEVSPDAPPLVRSNASTLATLERDRDRAPSLRGRRQLLGLGGDWRCVDSAEYFAPDYPVVVVEHHTDAAHGDVCRNPTTKDYFCPLGCASSPAAPWCRSTKSPAKPCRFPQGEAGNAVCTASSAVSVSLGTPARQRALLERYGAMSSHGDVCREPPPPTGDYNPADIGPYFCPSGCTATAGAPYCAAETGAVLADGSAPRPCRIPGGVEAVFTGATLSTAVPAQANLPAPAASPQSATASAAATQAAAAGALPQPSALSADIDALEAQLAAITVEQKAAAAVENFGRVAALHMQAVEVTASLEHAIAAEKAAAQQVAEAKAAQLAASAAAAATEVAVVSTYLSSRLGAALGKLKSAQKEAAQKEDYQKVASIQRHIDRLEEHGRVLDAALDEATVDSLQASGRQGSLGGAVGLSGAVGTGTGATALSAPCTMHTFFASMAESAAEEEATAKLVADWRKAWESNGWKTRVLSEDDAKSHHAYGDVKRALAALPTVNPREYETACFIRHLAMANVGGGWMADYDVIPLALPACAAPSNGGAFTTHEGFVPALVSGSAGEYLRVSRLFGSIPWAAHPEIFSFDGQPHVSDMLALQHLLGLGAVQAYGPLRCGVIEAYDVFDGAGGVRCRDSCPRPPQPEGAETGASDGADSGDKALAGARTHGPLGAHFSHASVDVLRKGAMHTALGADATHADASVSGSSSGSASRWMPPDVAASLVDLHNPRASVSVHAVRGRLVALGTDGYKKACPTAISGEPKPYVAPPGIVSNFGQNCHNHCGGDAGLCPQFCGPAGSCCRKGFHNDNVDPSCGMGTQGCEGQHCCVRAARGTVAPVRPRIN